MVKIVLLPPKPNDPESNYTFQFPSLTDREAFKDALAGLLAAVKSEPEQASQATPTVNTTHLTPEEAKMRQKILETNSDLNKLFRDLVQGGIIKEEEFWENRKVGEAFIVIMDPYGNVHTNRKPFIQIATPTQRIASSITT